MRHDSFFYSAAKQRISWNMTSSGLLDKCEVLVIVIFIAIGFLCSLYTFIATFFYVWLFRLYFRCEKQKCHNAPSDTIVLDNHNQTVSAFTSGTENEITSASEADLLSDAYCDSHRAFLFFNIAMHALSFFALFSLAVGALYKTLCVKHCSERAETLYKYSAIILVVFACPVLICLASAALPFFLIPAMVFLFSTSCVDCVKERRRKRRFRARRVHQMRALTSAVGHSSTSVTVVSSVNQPPSTSTCNTPTHLPSPSLSRMFEALLNQGFIERATNPAVLELVGWLVEDTWQARLTGLGRDARGLTHSKIKIRDVYRIHNDRLTSRYSDAYQRSKSRGITNVATTTFKTSQVLRSNAELMRGLFELRKDEVLLFHGTKKNHVTGIIQKGFQAKKNTRSPYGKGTYLTDSAQKADQYTDESGSRGRSELTMFVVRVALGWMVDQQFQHLDCDTVLAGKGKLFQELVVKRDELLLPQYLIVYDRI